MKAHLMTLAEYQEQVTPFMKEYFKFIKKYPQYFIYDLWANKHLTLNEYLDKEMERATKSKYSGVLDKDYHIGRWAERQKTQPIADVPSEILKQRDDYHVKLVELFGEKHLNIIFYNSGDETKSNKRAVRRAIDDNSYVNHLLDGEVTPDKLQAIADSVGVKLPKNIQQMKDKVSSQKYDRSALNLKAARDKEFMKQVYAALGENIDKLKKRFQDRIEYFIELWQNSKNYESDFLYHNKDIMAQRMMGFVDNKRQKVNGYEAKIDAAATDYANEFVAEFVNNINSKMVNVNENFGYPEIEVGDLRFGNGRLEGNVYLNYKKFTITAEVEVILAGGYNIVSLHQRYLIKLFKDGKKVNAETLDGLKESRFMDFETFTKTL